MPWPLREEINREQQLFPLQSCKEKAVFLHTRPSAVPGSCRRAQGRAAATVTEMDDGIFQARVMLWMSSSHYYFPHLLYQLSQVLSPWQVGFMAAAVGSPHTWHPL